MCVAVEQQPTDSRTELPSIPLTSNGSDGDSPIESTHVKHVDTEVKGLLHELLDDVALLGSADAVC